MCPPSPNTAGLSVEEFLKRHRLIARESCHLTDEADNHGLSQGEDGYFNETKGFPVEIQLPKTLLVLIKYLSEPRHRVLWWPSIDVDN